MQSYYDILQLSPDASSAEIEAAIDTSYNQNRQLVTHPDPTTRVRAEESLRSLEDVRATLLDPNRRAAYDATIGLSGTGGLADPTATPQSASPPPKNKVSGNAATAVADLWSCPNCSTPNPEWTPYCLHCRTTLLRECPECGQMKSLVKTGTCGNCGFEYATAEKRAVLRQEIQGLNEQLMNKQEEAGKAAARLNTIKKEQKGSSSALLGTLLFLLPGAFFLFRAVTTYGWGGNANWIINLLLALPFLIFAGIRLSRASKKKKSTQKEKTELPQHITTLNAEVAGLQNELQGKQAAFDHLDQ